jgi:hypothetical protein
VILTIDNLDGLGPVDYTSTLCGSFKHDSGGFRIVRTLNQPSTLDAVLCLEGAALALPARRARLVASSDTGTVLFTGYLTVEPLPLYAGVATEGPVYRLALRAVSDEWLLDRQAGLPRIGTGLAATGGALLRSLLGRIAPAGITAGTSADARPVGVFEPESAAPWSRNAGALAGSAYGAYRVLDGALTLAPAGATTHTLSDGDGSLNVAALKTSSVRELANDVTVTGAMEPVVYWNELFQGDGTTLVFDLTGQPDAVNAGHAVLIRDTFAQPTFDPSTWAAADPGSHLGLTGAGLTVAGGNGLDGQTTLAALDPIELGGTVIIELDGVQIGGGQFGGASAGTIGALYQGAIEQANCFAGFNVRQASGQTVLVPLVNGVEVGTVFPLLAGHLYTLRLRLHCPELLRVRQAFYAMSDRGSGSPVDQFQVNQFGGGLVDAPVSVVFEVADLGLSSNTPVTVLYDGSVASSPAGCTLAAVNSVQLFGSIGAVRVNRTGSGWVRGTNPTTGVTSTRLVGAAGLGLDCTLTGSALTGKVTFFDGRAPAPGEIVSVSYRGRWRSVARMQNTASVAAETAAGAPGTARWLGHVVKPPARSSEDCEAAAQAVLSFASNRAAATQGACTAVNPATGDIWPGDALNLTRNSSGPIQAIVRKVTIIDQGASPETLTYQIAFANDWAEGLGMTLSEAIADDALLPATATDATVAESARVLPNLQQLTVAGATGANTALLVDAGLDPPQGGGFEVRRRDGGFGLNTGDLVLRSPVRAFTLPVAATGQAFFIRMYDASTPTLYSRASSAVVTHLPVG